MKRKATVEGGCENTNPVSQINNVNPSKRIRTSQRTESEDDQWEDENEDLLEAMGVQVLGDNSSQGTTLSSKQKVLQPVDENRSQETDETDSGVGVSSSSWGSCGKGVSSSWGSCGQLQDDSLDCSAISVGSFDGSSSYEMLPKKDILGPDKFFTYQQKQKQHPLATKPGPGGDKAKKEVKKEDLINQMSDEVFLSMFRWLPKSTLARCARVCKRWQRLTVDESLWRRLDLGMVTVIPGVLGQVLTRGCQVLRLARATVNQPVFTFPLSSGRASKLQYLDLSMTSTSPSCLVALIGFCTKLRKLSLEMNTVTEAACSAVGKNKGMEVLHLGGVSGLTSRGLDKILTGCCQLVELNLGWTNLTEDSLDAVVGKSRPGLERLCLSGNRDTLTDSHVTRLSVNCPNLKELDLSDATKLTAASLTVVAERLTGLESLSTSRCYGITPSSYLMLANGCPALLYLNIFGLLRDPAMVELRERLKGIEINKFMFTSVARPTVGIKRTSIWNLRVRD